MPSIKRFAFLRATVRNHPVVVASSAATGGVLLGAFVAVQLLATPTPQPRADRTPVPQAALASPAVPKPAAETTGSAPAGDSVASADCERQTWPYLSRPCMDEMRNRNRTRVISTDKLDKPTVTAIEAPTPPAPAVEVNPAPAAPVAPAVASTALPAAPPATAPPTTATAADTVPATAAALTAPEPAPAAKPADAQAAKASPPSAARNEAKKEKRVARKSTRKPKTETAKRESDDDDDSAFASDDRGFEARAEARSGRPAAVGERWTERDYDVPSANGAGRRRITVIRRSGGGLFESLFGGD
jgi:hypothetical protein